MNTARLERCKELYHLSGWKGTDYFYQFIEYSDLSTGYHLVNPALETPLHANAYPAYDLGYLVRKLREQLKVSLHADNKGWECTTGVKLAFADTPEDATCKLAIELFKQGILKRE